MSRHPLPPKPKISPEQPAQAPERHLGMIMMQAKSKSYPLMSMKNDQANKTNGGRGYRWWPLAWALGPNGSGIDLWLVQEWVQCSCISCTSMLQSWSRVEADRVGGGQGQVEKGKGGHTMTLPPSYATTSQSGIASP